MANERFLRETAEIFAWAVDPDYLDEDTKTDKTEGEQS